MVAAFLQSFGSASMSQGKIYSAFVLKTQFKRGKELNRFLANVSVIAWIDFADFRTETK